MAEHKMENVHLSHHRVMMHLNRGGLHSALGISPNKEIPADRLEAATHSTNSHVKRMAVLARTMKSWHHGK